MMFRKETREKSAKRRRRATILRWGQERMQFTMTTDYAIRCLLFLAQNEGVSTSQRVREYAGITSDEHTRKILRQLKYGGLVRSDKGASGGYTLMRPADKITLYDVVRCTEDSIKMDRCLEEPNGAGDRKDEALTLYRFFEKTQSELERMFRSVTLKDILEGKI